MVLRNKKLSTTSDTAELSVSFGAPDVKELLKIYVSSFVEAVSENFARTIKEDELSIRHWFENDGRAFLSWPDKWKVQLSAWAFAVAVRDKYLIPTVIDPNKYYFADCLYKKVGRPRNEE